jgi:single-strand DNA-binding protein
VNRVILIGFLGEAPELKFSSQGKAIGTFSLAVNERWKDADGARRERVEWFHIVCFGRLAEVCGQYLDRSRHVYIEGRLQTRKWEDRGGEKRTTIEVIANQMQILDRAPKNGNGEKADESPKAEEAVDESDNPFKEPGNETTDQEIPF